jgi:hypothetical protein
MSSPQPCVHRELLLWQPNSIALIRALRSSRRHSQTIGFLVDTDSGDSIRTIGSAERIDLEIRSTSSPYLCSKWAPWNGRDGWVRRILTGRHGRITDSNCHFGIPNIHDGFCTAESSAGAWSKPFD